MKIDNNRFVPECFIDSCLVEVLLQADIKQPVNHEKSNGRVAIKMEEFKDGFCLGIIDEDRKQLNYLKQFVKPEIETPHLKLWKHPERHHYIIQIRPVIEKWILDICNDANIDLTELSLPNDLRSLQKLTKSVTARRDDKMIRLFKRLSASQHQAVTQLKNWLIYLKEKNVDADINELKNA